jgi:hypothetical protein
MPFPVDAYQSEISQIVGDVFQTMLSVDIEASSQLWTPRAGYLFRRNMAGRRAIGMHRTAG